MTAGQTTTTPCILKHHPRHLAVVYSLLFLCPTTSLPAFSQNNSSFARHLRFPLSQCKTGVFVRWAGKCITVASHQAAGSKMSKNCTITHVRIRKRWITSIYQNGFQTSSDLKTQIMYIILLQQGRGCLTCCYIFLRLA